MEKYEIRLNLDLCQGQFVCTAADPKHFRETEESKAELIGGTKEGNLEKLQIGSEELEKAKIAANGCAFDAIELIDLESGDLIAGG